MSEPTPAAPDLTNLFAEARALALAAAVADNDDGQGHVLTRLVPRGYTVDHHHVERYDETPSRQRGEVQLLTTASLAEHVLRHQQALTVGYVMPASGPSITVIYNDHGQPVDDAGWRDHRATLRYTPTPGWLRWTKADRKMMDQVEFAELVEDGLTEIASPAGADLLEIVQTIHATTAASFRSAQRLRDGQVQISYVEDVAATAGADGRLTIPTTITLLVSPFFGAAPVTLTARLRYRVGGGKLALGIVLDDPVGVVQRALDTEVAALREMIGEGTPLLWAHAAPSPVEPLS